MIVALVSTSYDRGLSGLGRYDRALFDELQGASSMQVRLRGPDQIPLLGTKLVHRALGLDVERFLTTYPLRPLRGDADLFHLTNQTLASALWSRPRQPVVITVHDIFPYLHRGDGRLDTYGHRLHRLMDAWAMRHIRRATAVIVDCYAGRDDLIRGLAVDPWRIHVVPLGVDHTRFQPGATPAAFWERNQLQPGTPFVLHVSSEEPRKNFETLVRAWRRVADAHPKTVLVKVGAAHYPRERARVQAAIRELGLERSVRFMDSVTDDDLVSFYDAASIFAFPSLAEGFGFPVLEAMACGAPVVCSDIASLRELVGEAAVRVPATDVDALARAIVRVLDDAEYRASLRQAGLARASQFTWERTAAATHEVYQRALDEQTRVRFG